MAAPTEAARSCVLLWRGEPGNREPVVHAVEAGGGEIVATVGRWAELLVAVVDERADVAVLDLAMAGAAGTRLVTALRDLAPVCHIVVVSELRAIDVASLEAGADAVVSTDDLRPLSAAVRAAARGRSSADVGGQVGGPLADR